MLNDKFRHLIALLDDEDELVAVNVISALLEHEAELGDLPGILQESENPLLRRRAHQLQAAMMFRSWRREFRANLIDETPDFFAGMVGLHMLWFDRDSRGEVEQGAEEFIAECRKRPLLTLDDLAAAMRRSGMICSKESIELPEIYCVGIIVEERIAAGSWLMGFLHWLAGNPDFQVVTVLGEFGIYDGRDKLLLGNGSWRVERAPEQAQMEFWTPQKLLQNCGNMLFSAAVSSDSHRYVLTIAQALSGAQGEEILKALPYPYGEQKN